MASQRVIEAILKFRIEKQTVSQTQQDLESIKAKMASLEKEAARLRRSIADAILHEEPFDYLERHLNKVDEEMKQAAQAAKIMGDAIEKSLKDASQQADRAKQKMQQLAEASEKFSSISLGVAAAGAAIAGPFVLAANSYVQSAGKSEATSRRWLAATNELARSQMRIGRVAAQAIVPVLEKVAGLAESAAGFAEKHPDVIKAALGVGGALVGIGTLGAVLGKGVKMYADARLIWGMTQQTIAATLMDQAATKQMTAAGLMGKAGLAGAAGNVAMVGTAAVASYGITEMWKSGATAFFTELEKNLNINAADQGGTYNAFRNYNTQYGGGIFGAGAFLGDLIQGKDVTKFQDLAKATDQAGEAAGDAANEMGGLENALNKGAILDSFIAYTKETERAERDYEKNRAEIIKQFGQQRVEIERNYEQQRAKAVADFEKQQSDDAADFAKQQAKEKADFLKEEARIEADYQRNRQKLIEDAVKANQQAEARYKRDVQKFLQDAKETEAKAEKEYYDRRKKAAEQYNLAVQRAEADHQKQMERAREDHDQRLEDAVRNQDATAFIQEQRSYEEQRKRAEEDYQDQASQQSEDYARQMAEMEEEFEAQREARAEERDKRLQEMQENFELEKAERDQQTQERLAEMDADFQREKEQRLADFQERQAEAATEFAERQAKEKEQHEARLAEMDAQHAEQMEKLNKEKEDRLEQLKQAFNDEKKAREDAFKDILIQLDNQLLKPEWEARKRYYGLMEQDLKAWLERQRAMINGSSGGSSGDTSSDGTGTGSGGSSGGNGGGSSSHNYSYPQKTPGLASGGYAAVKGFYQMAEEGKEFVLSNRTTRAVESRMGGSLTQDSVLAALSGRSGGSAGGSANLMQQFYISSDVDVDRVLSEAKRQAEGLIQETIRGY